MGRGKSGYVLQMEKEEPEPMYSEAKILTTFDELFDHFAPPGHELARALP
jgi:hypothetical protein